MKKVIIPAIFILLLLVWFFIFKIGQNAITSKPVDSSEVAFKVKPGLDSVLIWGDRIAVHSDKNGNIFVMDCSACRIIKFDSDFNYVLSFGSKGKGPGEFTVVYDFNIGYDGKIYVFEFTSSTVNIFDNNGIFDKAIKVNGVYQKISIVADSEGNIYVNTPREKKFISVFDKNGTLINQFGEKIDPGKNKFKTFANIAALMLDENQKLYAAFYTAPILRKYDLNGTLLKENRISTGKIEKKAVEEKGDPDSGINTFYFYLDNFLYTGVNLYASSCGELLQLDKNNLEVKNAFSAMKSDKGPFFNCITYNNKSGDILFCQQFQGIIYKCRI